MSKNADKFEQDSTPILVFSPNNSEVGNIKTIENESTSPSRKKNTHSYVKLFKLSPKRKRGYFQEDTNPIVLNTSSPKKKEKKKVSFMDEKDNGNLVEVVNVESYKEIYILQNQEVQDTDGTLTPNCSCACIII